MGAHNPLKIRICGDGAARNKYGRAFEHNDREFKRQRRRKAVTPAVNCMQGV